MTERPYKFIFNGSVTSSAAGLALSGGSRPVAETAFPDLHAITAPLKVARSEGSLIDELDNANHTALSILESHRSSGEMATGKAEITVSPICSCSRLDSDLLRSTEKQLNATAIGSLRLSVKEYGGQTKASSLTS